ncbi:MAG: hypothetical protein A2583_09110 [Bdellovibrionales bacterium RIFOXYD1_FULL_53_11]|nr:MAG: hypothetical protein A2583_09110 [Bdellovibrionales bacterium RIFOXYD1_FULL_53_11]
MAFKPGVPGGATDHDADAAGDDIVAEINITPLTDIFLVLLIIFMVTSSVMSQLGVEVNLPKASNAIAESQPDGVIVSLLPSGAMKVNLDTVPSGDFKTLEFKIREAFAKTASRLVIIEGDRQAFLGSAIEVMDRARKAGAATFAVATAPTPGDK